MTRNVFAVFSNGELAKHRKTLRRSLFLAVIAVFCLGISLRSQAQESAAKERKLITRVEPQYPATLERLYIGGVVRLEVVVAPNGNVQSATLIGGTLKTKFSSNIGKFPAK